MVILYFWEAWCFEGCQASIDDGYVSKFGRKCHIIRLRWLGICFRQDTSNTSQRQSISGISSGNSMVCLECWSRIRQEGKEHP